MSGDKTIRVVHRNRRGRVVKDHTVATHPERKVREERRRRRANAPRKHAASHDAPLSARYPTDAASVVVPCHDYAEFLPQCLDSLISQSEPFEMIVVVNDSSTDDTAAIGKRYAREHESIVYVEGTWGNVALSRQAGMEKTATPLVAFVDADNWLDAGWLEALRPFMQDPQVGVVFSPPMITDRAGNTLSKAAYARAWDYWAMRRTNHVDACALMRRRAIQQAGNWQQTDVGVGMEDWLLYLNMTRIGWRIHVYAPPLWHYRLHADQMTKTNLRGYDEYQSVYEQAFHLAVAIPFCGREWMLPRLPGILRSIGWPPERTHGIFLDNSGDHNFGVQLRRTIHACTSEWASVTFINDRAVTSSIGQANSDFADDAGARVLNAEGLSDTMCRIYARQIQRLLGQGIDLVLTIEDDIEPIGDDVAIRLLRGLDEDVMACSGVVRGRFEKTDIPEWVIAADATRYEPYVHRMLTDEPDADRFQDVDGTGMGLLLSRAEAWHRHMPRRIGVDGDQNKWWHDLAFGRDVKLAGWRWLLRWDVRCRHWGEDDTWV